jgi:hypothetical protein
MNRFFQSLGGAFNWAHNLKKDADAIVNIDANRSMLLRRVRHACTTSGFDVEVVRQPAVLPALEVAVRLGDKQRSAYFEYGGDNWQDIVLGVLDRLTGLDEATIFLQLEAREARAYVCCLVPRDGNERTRKVTLVDVVDSHNLGDAYLEATAERPDR